MGDLGSDLLGLAILLGLALFVYLRKTGKTLKEFVEEMRGYFGAENGDK